MDPVEPELAAYRVELVAEALDAPRDIRETVRLAAADLVVEDDGALVGECLERCEVVVRRAGSAVERDQRRARSVDVADDSVPRAATLPGYVSLVRADGRRISRCYLRRVDETQVDFEECTQQALDSLPAELRDAMSNVAIVIEDEPPDGRPLLGLYQGVPLTRRSSSYAAVAPDKISIFRGPLERYFGRDPERLRAEIRHVVLHEVAHHFGISDERLRELDRY